MDRFEDMRCFLEVVDRRSVTRAAEAMSIAPSAVSRRIKDLEARLGAQLLTRTTRSMSLTEAGQSFYDRARAILAEVEEAESEVADAGRALHGPLRIAAPLSFGVRHLAPVFAAFAGAHPEVELDIDLSDRQVDLVAEGFDLAVRIGSLRDSSLVARKLCDVRMIVCASPAFVERRGVPEGPEAMKGWPCLAYVGSERFDIWRWRGPGGATGSVQMTVAMRSNNGDVLSEAAAAGLGVTLQPSFIVHEALASGRLRCLLTDHSWSASAVHVIYPETRHLSAKCRAFIDFLAARLGPSPYWEEGLGRASPSADPNTRR